MVWSRANKRITKTRKKLKIQLKTELKSGLKLTLTTAAKITVVRAIRAIIRAARPLSTVVRVFTRALDAVLPGKHTKRLYQRDKKEAKVLAQLQTGANRLNSYLYKVGATETNQYSYGAAAETVKHFLFLCINWFTERKRFLYDKWPRKMGDTSFFLGGRSTFEDPQGWSPDWDAVNTTIAYAAATTRLDYVASGDRG